LEDTILFRGYITITNDLLNLLAKNIYVFYLFVTLNASVYSVMVVTLE